MKKLLSIVLAMVMVSSLGGCFRRDKQEDIDPNKTYLYIGNYEGGLGDQWLNKVAENYMELHKDVVIKINNEKDKYGDAYLLENMSSFNNDMYFINAISYQNYIASGAVADITEEVTTKLDGETRSIADKMSPTLKDYYCRDGKYYAVPFFDSIFGTMYDVDLFDEYQFYFNTDGELLCDGPANTKLGFGPNGIEGDYDDGLPATFDQWKILVDTMKQSAVIPYIWTGEYTYYRWRFLTSIWADYEGKENFDINYSFNGNYTFDGDTEPTKIDYTNAYLLQKQLGKKYALDMGEYIVRNNLYFSQSFDGVNTHTMAQNEYLQSVESQHDRIAMILEGTWWENEARDYFDLMASQIDEKYAYGTRRFSFMPVPKTEKSSKDTTLISSTGNSVVFVSNYSPNKELAKDFLRFAHSDEALKIFTTTTGVIRPYDYQLTEEELNKLTYYGRSMWDIYRSENTKISYVSLYYGEPLIFYDKTFLGSAWWWDSTVNHNGKTVKMRDALYEFQQESWLTSDIYFKGLSNTFNKTIWDEKMSKYY